MNRLRSLSLAFSLFAFVLLLAACDTVHDEPRVRSINLRFSMDDATFNGNVASVSYDVPELDARVAAGGAVLAFFREQNTWTAMPYTYAVDNPDLQAVDYTITLGYAFEDRFVEVFYEASTPQAPLENQPDRTVKLVIIDADVVSSGKTTIDHTDWQQVKSHYGLTD